MIPWFDYKFRLARWGKIDSLAQYAKSYAHKMKPEIREKIVKLNRDELLKKEEDYRWGYAYFMNRRDIEEIKEKHPEVIEFMAEPIRLIEMAYEKLSAEEPTPKEPPYKKPTTEERRAQMVKWETVKSEDDLAVFETAFETERRFHRMVKQKIKDILEDESLTEEEKEEQLQILEALKQARLRNITSGGNGNEEPKEPKIL